MPHAPTIMVRFDRYFAYNRYFAYMCAKVIFHELLPGNADL